MLTSETKRRIDACRDGRIRTMFLTEVNGFAYSHSEELGNAFEYLLQCMGTQGENGQFRTPRHIIDFIVACLDPQPGDKILDPACGTGGFLVSAYRHILAHSTSPGSTMPGDKLTHAQRQKVYGNLAGYDVDDQMVKLSKVNLFLHGFPDPAIHIYDTLSNDARWHEKADLILANPPFMTPKGGVTPHTKFRIAAKKAEVLFTDYIAEHLSGDGRGGVIVPNGIVATTQNAYVKLRRFLVEDSLVAVVSLPGGVFRPYSAVKTSILLLDKELARKSKHILFLKITADGFDLGDKRNPIEANDLPEAERVVKAWLKGMTNVEFRMTNGSAMMWATVEKKSLIEHRAEKAKVRVGYLAEDPNTLQEAYVATNTGRMEDFSFVFPLAWSLEYLMLWTDKSRIVTYGIASTAGVIAGSAVYALASKSFRWEGFRDAEDTGMHLIGGLLMGFGGITALGCTIGQGISGFSTLAAGSIMTFLAIIAGSAATMKWQYWRMTREA